MRNRAGLPTHARRLAGLGLSIVAFVVLLGAGAPATLEPGSINSLAESGGGASAGGGNGGNVLSSLGPLLFVALAIALVVLVAAAVILFRTRGAVATPASAAEGWWTCAACGAGNMDGAARCHNCATWRTTTSRPNPSVQP